MSVIFEVGVLAYEVVHHLFFLTTLDLDFADLLFPPRLAEEPHDALFIFGPVFQLHIVGEEIPGLKLASD